MKTNFNEVKKVLNVGGNDKELISLPKCFDGWLCDTLDIDPGVNPDILCDARELWRLSPRQYDAIYCSHNLEHFFAHEVPKVLKGINLVLKKDGFVYIRVPDLIEVMKLVVNNKVSLDGLLYVSNGGLHISPIDVIYGYRKQIERSGVDFFAHKTGFSSVMLVDLLKNAGFHVAYTFCNNLEISAFGFKVEPSDELMAMLGLQFI